MQLLSKELSNNSASSYSHHAACLYQTWQQHVATQRATPTRHQQHVAYVHAGYAAPYFWLFCFACCSAYFRPWM